MCHLFVHFLRLYTFAVFWQVAHLGVETRRCIMRSKTRWCSRHGKVRLFWRSSLTGNWYHQFILVSQANLPRLIFISVYMQIMRWSYKSSFSIQWVLHNTYVIVAFDTPRVNHYTIVALLLRILASCFKSCEILSASRISRCVLGFFFFLNSTYLASRFWHFSFTVHSRKTIFKMQGRGLLFRICHVSLLHIFIFFFFLRVVADSVQTQASV